MFWCENTSAPNFLKMFHKLNLIYPKQGKAVNFSRSQKKEKLKFRFSEPMLDKIWVFLLSLTENSTIREERKLLLLVRATTIAKLKSIAIFFLYASRGQVKFWYFLQHKERFVSVVIIFHFCIFSLQNWLFKHCCLIPHTYLLYHFGKIYAKTDFCPILSIKCMLNGELHFFS